MRECILLWSDRDMSDRMTSPCG